MSGWQPIETAPRDKPLLLFARLETATAPVSLIGWWAEDFDGWIAMAFYPNRSLKVVASHWMPLLSPESGL